MLGDVLPRLVYSLHPLVCKAFVCPLGCKHFFATLANSPIAKGAISAWISFNGTGTIAIRDSFNVSSIVDNSTGEYTVNFTTAMANANYSVTTGGGEYTNTHGLQSTVCPFAIATGSFRLDNLSAGAGSHIDSPYICAHVIGDV